MENIERKKFANVSIEVICVGKYKNDLSEQVKQYFNKDVPLGIGITDGNPVPERFIKVYEFNIEDVQVLELFSDGYYVMPDKASIKAWESLFANAEKEDPLRWLKYPAVKYSTETQFSDDRTILIVRFR